MFLDMFTFNFLHGFSKLIQTPWAKVKRLKLQQGGHMFIPNGNQQKKSKPHQKFEPSQVSIPILVQRLKRRRLFSVFIIAWRNRSRVTKGGAPPQDPAKNLHKRRLPCHACHGFSMVGYMSLSQHHLPTWCHITFPKLCHRKLTISIQVLAGQQTNWYH